MSDVVIRRATPDDARALALVGAATFLESYAHMIGTADMLKHLDKNHSEEAYGRALADPDHALWIAGTASVGTPVGYAMFTPPNLPIDGLTSQDCELRRIYILSRHHGGGVGRRMTQMLTEHAQSTGKTRLFVGVHAGNDGAIAFYRRTGFVDAGRRIFRVGDTDYDDLIFAKPLASA